MKKENGMELFYKVALSFVGGVGVKNYKKLMEHFGTAEAVFQARAADLKIKGMQEAWIQNILGRHSYGRAEKEMNFIAKNHIKVVCHGDEDYPDRFSEIDDSPFLFYYKGQDVLRSKRIISIVGTRNASSYGRRVCKEFIAQLKPYDVVIVSGLAYGIDCFAHQAAVDHGIPTIGVMGHGLNMVYPEAHTGLADRMLKDGGLLSEFPSQTMPERFNFPMRNRIIAGLAHATVVVEAAKKGGALITAELANSYNRDVFAFPGSIFQELSEGCNHLIKTNKAVLIHGVRDLEYHLGWERPSGLFAQSGSGKRLANPQEAEIVDFLHQNGPATMDRVAESTGLSISSLSLILLQMELKQLVMPLPGKVYVNC